MIYPVTTTRHQWDVYHKALVELLDIDPSRMLDKANVRQQEPASLISTLGTKEAKVTEYNVRFDYFAILTKQPKETLDVLANWSDLRHHRFNETVAYVAGTVDVWIREIKQGCKDTVDKRIRRYHNELYNIFKQSPYKTLFDEKELLLWDGTFQLR